MSNKELLIQRLKDSDKYSRLDILKKIMLPDLKTKNKLLKKVSNLALILTESEREELLAC